MGDIVPCEPRMKIAAESPIGLAQVEPQTGLDPYDDRRLAGP